MKLDEFDIDFLGDNNIEYFSFENSVKGILDLNFFSEFNISVKFIEFVDNNL